MGAANPLFQNEMIHELLKKKKKKNKVTDEKNDADIGKDTTGGASTLRSPLGNLDPMLIHSLLSGGE